MVNGKIAAKAGRLKYGNKIVLYDNIKFRSIKEKDRYIVLRILEKKGLISDLRMQVRYNFEINGVKICAYDADFVYCNNFGGITVEDVKGVKTNIYLIKKKMMKAFFGIEIKET